MNEYPQGTVVRASVEVRDTGGTLVDPSALFFSLTQPGQSAVVYTYGVGNRIVRDSTGRYHVDVDTTPTAGFWTGRWYSTGIVVAAQPWQVFVVPINSTVPPAVNQGPPGPPGAPGPQPSGGADGQFVRRVSSAAAWTTLTQDMILPAFTIDSFSGGSVVEVGASVISPTFSASYNRSAIYAKISDGTNPDVVLSSPFTSVTEPHTYQSNSVNGAKTFTLTAYEDVASQKTATASIAWQARARWDVATPATIDAAFIASLANSQLQGGFAQTLAFSAGGGTKKLYYAFATSFGTPTSFLDPSTGFSVPFSKVGSAVNVTNANGVVIAHDVWTSDFLQTSAISVRFS